MNTNIICGNNWYRVWNISGSFPKRDPQGNITEVVQYSSIVVSDDEKLKTFEIICTDAKEADKRMRTIAFALDMAVLPLWVILAVPREKLSRELYEYECKRLNYYGIKF